jgi:hypothetical protein
MVKDWQLLFNLAMCIYTVADTLECVHACAFCNDLHAVFTLFADTVPMQPLNGHKEQLHDQKEKGTGKRKSTLGPIIG